MNDLLNEQREERVIHTVNKVKHSKTVTELATELYSRFNEITKILPKDVYTGIAASHLNKFFIFYSKNEDLLSEILSLPAFRNVKTYSVDKLLTAKLDDDDTQTVALNMVIDDQTSPDTFKGHLYLHSITYFPELNGERKLSLTFFKK